MNDHKNIPSVSKSYAEWKGADTSLIHWVFWSGWIVCNSPICCCYCCYCGCCICPLPLFLWNVSIHRLELQAILTVSFFWKKKVIWIEIEKMLSTWLWRVRTKFRGRKLVPEDRIRSIWFILVLDLEYQNRRSDQFGIELSRADWVGIWIWMLRSIQLRLTCETLFRNRQTPGRGGGGVGRRRKRRRRRKSREVVWMSVFDSLIRERGLIVSVCILLLIWIATVAFEVASWAVLIIWKIFFFYLFCLFFSWRFWKHSNN